METELSFLLDLFLNEKLPVGIKKLVAERLKAIEGQRMPVARPQTVRLQPLQEGDVASPPIPTTAAAQAALAQRAALIEQAVAGKALPKHREFK